jgi:hypothetical protein
MKVLLLLYPTPIVAKEERKKQTASTNRHHFPVALTKWVIFSTMSEDF